MLSNKETRSALRSILITAINANNVDLELTNIAWENKTFSNLSDYILNERLFPIDDEPSSNESDGGLGIYELTLNVSKGLGTEQAEDICSQICNSYEIGEGGFYNNTRVVIDQARVEVTLEDSNYWTFPIRIDYRKYNIAD